MFIAIFIFRTVSAYKQHNWYYDNRIHNFGNVGLGGKLHAYMAPHTSKIIDRISYNNENIRLKSIYGCKSFVNDDKLKILDMGCGVGISTKSIELMYPRSYITGIDCSVSMLNNCPKYTSIDFKKGFVHKTKYDDNLFDFINCMFLFHEVPNNGRKDIFDEINRILKPGGYLNILDIRLNYEPNKFMLSGEPFLLDYLSNFENEINNIPFQNIDKKPVSDKQLDLLFKKIES